MYLQDLPLGYVAKSVSQRGDNVVIAVERADKSIYGLLDEEGDIALTPDIYEFYPAENVEAVGAEPGFAGDGLSYEGGTLSMTVSLNGAKATVSISNLHLSHSVSGGDISLSLSGNWNIDTTVSAVNDSLAEVPLGEIRVMGVGRIAVSLSLTQQASVHCNLGGTFNTGFTATQGGEASASKGFSVSNRTVEGNGTISASLKITAGVDVLFAAADLYAEIGVRTQYTSKTTYHPETQTSTHCDDIKVYLFSIVGFEAKYYSVLSGDMEPLASKTFYDSQDTNHPYIIHIHYENGVRTSCSQGMDVPDLHYGGFDDGFDGTVLTENRSRILETNLDLPWDMTVKDDLTLWAGRLNLNGHTLTVNGNLIHAGGTLVIGNGALIVHGDYRMQSKTNGVYGDSTGTLIMKDSGGSIAIDGDFVVQTSSDSNQLTAGTLSIGGNITQRNARTNTKNLVTGSSCQVVMTNAGQHVIQFEDYENNEIHNLALQNNARVPHSINLHDVELNGFTLTVQGDAYHRSGTLNIGSGALVVNGGYYQVGADSVFTPGKENYTDTASSCFLKMQDPDGVMRVGGSFVTHAHYGTHDVPMSAGTLYIGGDFRQFGGYYSNNFAPGENHKTVFNGAGKQIICFEKTESSFGRLAFANTDIELQNYVGWARLESDMTAVSQGADLNGRTKDVNGHAATITGDVLIGSSIVLNKGCLTVTGDVLHYGGTIDIDEGELTVNGNYYQAGKDSVLAAGKENYTDTASSCFLKMQDPDGVMRVGGSFVTHAHYGTRDVPMSAGTLYIGGDFRQFGGYYSNNFAPAETHRTVLNGTKRQRVCFGSSSSRFGTLEIARAISYYEFEPNPCWITLIQREQPVFGEPGFALPAALGQIEDSAFEGIAATVVYVPDTCVSIGEYAFRDAALQQIRIPEHCAIADTAFDGCEYLVIFGTPGSAAEDYCEAHDNCAFVAE